MLNEHVKTKQNNKKQMKKKKTILTGAPALPY